MQIEVTDRDRRYAADLDDMPRRFGGAQYPNGKVALDGGWSIRLAEDDPVARCGATSLARFLDKYCGLSLPVSVGSIANKREIVISWSGEAGEGYCVNVNSDGVEIHGDSPAGALYGAHRFQWMMGENGGSYLEPGSFRVEPGAAVRITATPFHQPFDGGGDPLTYTDGYLDLMAHYGFNGLHMYIDLFEYMETPGFANPKAAERMASLAGLARRAAPYNIGIYLHPNTTRRRASDPIFTQHPELKGAESWEPGYHCYCSSEPLTAEIYAEALKGVFRQVPEVKGAIAIIGGECLLHCYMRPTSRELNGTNCPRCAERKPSEVVADFANAIARSVWDERPDADFMVWPYSGYIWSESHEQRELISLLDQRMGFLTCYEKDAWVEVEGTRQIIFDYSICYVGPSDRYVVQRDLCAARGLPFYIKTESSIAMEIMSVPYIPVMENWRTRWQGMMADKPHGVLANWRFTGLSGTLSEELAYRETWRSPSDGDALARMALRLAGEDGRDDILAAWRLLSQSFSKLIYCTGLQGAPYFTGPTYLGPAHPLVISSEQAKQLPQGFFAFDACFVEMNTDINVDSLPKQPRFFQDTRWTEPLGPEKMRRAIDSICEEWDKGLELYMKALERAPSELKPGLLRELDAALMTTLMLKAARSLARFQLERDRALSGRLSGKDAEESRRRLEEIVEDDLANSRLSLELAERNYRYGYGFVYGAAFDADLIRAKIAFTEQHLLPAIREL